MGRSTAGNDGPGYGGMKNVDEEENAVLKEEEGSTAFDRRPRSPVGTERDVVFDKGHIGPGYARTRVIDDKVPPIRLIDETDKPIWSPKIEDDKAPICPIFAEEEKQDYVGKGTAGTIEPFSDDRGVTVSGDGESCDPLDSEQMIKQKTTGP